MDNMDLVWKLNEIVVLRVEETIQYEQPGFGHHMTLTVDNCSAQLLVSVARP